MPSSTTYLQVPKALPNRRSRSRSRSRSGAAIAGACLSSRRPTTPPIIMKEEYARRQYTCSYNSTHTTSHKSTAYTNGHHRSVYAPPPSIRLPSTELCDYYTLSRSRSQSRSPSPQPPLRNRLIGAWSLESYIAYPTPSSQIQRPTYPMTKGVTGLIMYTPDGYMSAQMLIPGQKSFKRGEGDEAQWAEAGKRCFSYAGPYYITNGESGHDDGGGGREVLRHTFQYCNLPGWIGDIQVRTWRFEEGGQVLVLGSEEPTEIKGDLRIPVLKWRRAGDKSSSEPPPPMPQIKVSGPGEP